MHRADLKSGTLYVTYSLLLRRFVLRMGEASAKRVTGDERKGPWEGYEAALHIYRICFLQHIV